MKMFYSEAMIYVRGCERATMAITKREEGMKEEINEKSKWMGHVDGFFSLSCY